MDIETIRGMLPFLVPLAILEVAVLVIALLDLIKREHVRGGNKVIWALVIIFVNVIGPIIYLVAGRRDSSDRSD